MRYVMLRVGSAAGDFRTVMGDSQGAWVEIFTSHDAKPKPGLSKNYPSI